MDKEIVLSPKTYNTSLDEPLRLTMYNFLEVQNRRISILPGISDGIIQDYGVHDKDKIISGTIRASISQANILKSIKEHSLISIWHLSVNSDCYEIYIVKMNEVDKFNDKIVFDIEFRVNDKVSN